MNRLNLIGQLIVIFVTSAELPAFAQTKIEPFAAGSLIGALKQPAFWQVSNKFGIMPSGNGVLLNIGAKGVSSISHKLHWIYGVSATAFASDVNNNIMMNELYAGFTYKIIRFRLGMFNEDEILYHGMSSTNGNIIWSTNARAMPGYMLESSFIPITNNKCLSLKFRLANYKTIDNRYTHHAYMHNSALYLNFNICKRFDFNGGFDIYKMWGGRSKHIKHPAKFIDYLRVLIGDSGDKNASNSDQINVLGDQRGRIQLEMNYHADRANITFYYNCPFDDRSGMSFHNIPDGLYGLYVERKHMDKNWICRGDYEFQFTKNQSGPRHNKWSSDGNTDLGICGGRDNYFNNADYKSGWTYYGVCIGSPFFLPKEKNDEGICMGFYNNAFVAHYISINGYLFHKYEYTFRGSFAKNRGVLLEDRNNHTKYNSYTYAKPKKQFSLGFDINIPTEIQNLNFAGGIYTDLGEEFKNTTGLTFTVNWK